MPAASSDDARGASSAASVLAPSEGETEDPRISAYVAHLAHVGDEMAPGLGALFADAFPEVPTLADIHEGFTFEEAGRRVCCGSLSTSRGSGSAKCPD